jgi:hypothetical protein
VAGILLRVSELEVLRARQEALEASNEGLREWLRGVDADAHAALDVARQNVKLMTALRATQLEHGKAIGGLVTEVAGVKADLAEFKAEFTEFKTEVKDGFAEVLRRLPA